MRVLYCTGGGVGNVVMSTPAIAALHAMGHSADVLVGRDTLYGIEDLLRGWAPVANVSRRLPPPSSYPLIVHSAWHRIPIGGLRELFAPTSPDVLRVTHEAEANMIPVRELGFTGPTPPPHVEVEPMPSALRDACPPGEYIVCAPGCKQEPFWRRKRWKGWLDLAPRLTALPVWLGCEDDAPCNEITRPDLLGHDLTGVTTLAEAASIIAGAKAVVAIDNGLAHVAAALGVPTVVLFGATSEVKNRPLGPRVMTLANAKCPYRPCQMTDRWEACTDWKCMDFEAEEVAEAVTDVLHRQDAKIAKNVKG